MHHHVLYGLPTDKMYYSQVGVYHNGIITKSGNMVFWTITIIPFGNGCYLAFSCSLVYNNESTQSDMRTLLHIVNLMRNRVTRSLYGQLNNEQSNERVMFDCRTVKNRMTGLLCSFALLRPTERTEIFMKSIIQIPRIPLFAEIEEPQSYAIYIFGTDNRLLQDADTFGDALTRYLNEYGITQDMFARMTGISQCTISRYLKNERKIRQRSRTRHTV